MIPPLAGTAASSAATATGAAGATGAGVAPATAGEGFERVLVAQLAKSLVPEGTGPYASMLPDALTDALMAGGGIGLARAIDG